MFQATRRRLALWYTTVTAVLLLLFASGFYLYVRSTLIERIDDTLNHVVEVVQRSLVIESSVESGISPRVNLEASFSNNVDSVEDDHIDLEWFSPNGELLWSTFSQPLNLPLHISNGETVHITLLEQAQDVQNRSLTDAAFSFDSSALILRQVTQRVQLGRQVLGYLRASHPWFEVTKPIRQLIIDLSLGTALTIGAVAAIGWGLSGLAIAPVRDSYQRLKQFTADASHELRNPIAVIQTNVQVALCDPDPQFQQTQLKVVERLTRRLGRLVDDLLFLARQDSGMTPLRTNAVALKQLLQEVVEEQQAIAIDQSIELGLTIQEGTDAYMIEGDRDQLTRLFTNLVSNAIQYTPAAGQVKIVLEPLKTQNHAQFQIRVQDTGIGIPEEAIPYLFDRFYRVDPARTHTSAHTSQNASGGSGLGLAIAKVIVENHQGQIALDSKPHQGTTFTVILPSHMSKL
ncbi:MAG: HAMP domain-containing sensor histidine kinase [Oculatellaceae cyanobacterium bins.114]|nr:HAMP domain-containing sensor histidine kinase [Oculatellaceae cyanobacterium bins.114]